MQMYDGSEGPLVRSARLPRHSLQVLRHVSWAVARISVRPVWIAGETCVCKVWLICFAFYHATTIAYWGNILVEGR